jgi:hypothetical protein
LIGLVWLEIQLVVHHMELVVGIILLQIRQILLVLQILLILLILSIQIWIIVVGAIRLRS